MAKKFCQQNLCEVWIKNVRSFQNLVLWFIIWLSARALIIHHLELLGRPSDLRAFFKPLGLLSENSFIFFFIVILQITPWCFMYLFAYMKHIFFVFLKSFSRIISLSKISLSNHSEELPFIFFNRRFTVSMTSIIFWMNLE